MNAQTLSPKKKFILFGYCEEKIVEVIKEVPVPYPVHDTVEIKVPFKVPADTSLILSMYCDTSTLPPVIVNPPKDTLWRGLYLNGFKNIVGDKLREDALLFDLKRWGFNSVHEYNLSDILGTSKESALAKLHIRMRKESGINDIVAARGNSSSCLGAATTFNKNNSDSADFDGWNLEFESWNAYPTATGGYTFDKTKSNSTSSTDASRGAAWNDNKIYLQQMKGGKANGQVDYSVQYWGWFKAPFEVDAPKAIVELTDYAIVHMYYSSPDFGRSKSRCTDLNTLAKLAGKKIKFRPIFSAEPDFMQAYYKTHSLDEAYFEWKKGFDAMNYSNLISDGYLVFALDFLRVAQPSNPLTKSIGADGKELMPDFADPEFENKTTDSHLLDAENQ